MVYLSALSQAPKRRWTETLQRRLYQVNYFNLLSLHREIGMLFAFRGVVNEAEH